MKFNKKELFFSILTIIATLAFLEIFLQIASLVIPKANELLSRPKYITPKIEDKRLGMRPNPSYPGHDRKGFRNKLVPDEADIVVLGDSQTYGAGVLRDQAWPQQLEKLSRIKTYNIAFGSYGPAHSLLLLEEAIELKPKLIILAFYAGNDLYDSYSLVYNLEQLPDLKTTDESVINNILELENIEPLEREIMRLWTIGKSEEKEPFYRVFREFLSRHSKLYGLLRMLKRTTLTCLRKPNKYKDMDWESIKQGTIKHKEYYQFFDNGEFKTVFTPNYRLCALNLDDPRIKEGLRISLEAIHLINERTKEANIEFAVLLIPTKERVFKDIVYRDSSNIPETYKILIENEELFWQRTKVFLKDQKIYFSDTLPALRECMQKGSQPYEINWNGHPNPAGHHAISEFTYSKIGRYNLKR